MAIEPQKRGSAPTNPYVGRWGWWYSAIADWMIRNPGRHLKDCALDLNKSANTISMIVNTDMFREYLARRKEEWRQNHDFAIISKVTAVAELSLDVLLEKMEKKRDQIPMNLVNEVATSALDRLGYGPRREPSVSVNVEQNDNRVVVAVDAKALAEARDAMRLAEERRAHESRLLESSIVGDVKVVEPSSTLSSNGGDRAASEGTEGGGEDGTPVINLAAE